jgi:hypothetical protein
MEFMVVYIVVLLVVAVVIGPICGAEDRPAFLRPDRRPRRNV